VDVPTADPTAYAFVYGIRRTRQTLASWRVNPWPVLGSWFAGGLLAATGLLFAVWAIAGISAPGPATVVGPPFVVGTMSDVTHIFVRNLLVLALHLMACVAGFIAGSSLPLQAQEHRGLSRTIHEHGGRLAIAFVIGATTFSLSAQAYVLGSETAGVASRLGTSPGVLLLVLAPHAVPELTALFLPLAAWILASRRDEWDRLLAATLVTGAIAVPMLFATALIEVYLAPHLVGVLVH
jgi:hypothetical protein